MANFAGETGEAPSTQVLRFHHIAAGAAGTATLEQIGAAPFAGNVTAVTFIPDATLTGQVTNFRTYTVNNFTQTLVPATLPFSSAPVVAPVGVKTAIPVSAVAAQVAVAAGDVLQLATTVTGTGLADVAGAIEVTITRSDIA